MTWVSIFTFSCRRCGIYVERTPWWRHLLGLTYAATQSTSRWVRLTHCTSACTVCAFTSVSVEILVLFFGDKRMVFHYRAQRYCVVAGHWTMASKSGTTRIVTSSKMFHYTTGAMPRKRTVSNLLCKYFILFAQTIIERWYATKSNYSQNDRHIGLCMI